MKRALLSVSNKENIAELATFLIKNGYELISTGGTARVLADNHIPYTPISEVTGNPEAFGGRMKTISFSVLSALLFRRENEDDCAQAKELDIKPIDLVICNLYPFKEVSRKTKDQGTLIENIDIGGPNMIRAAAKNFKSVTILTNPNQYPEFMKRFSHLYEAQRYEYALEAFKMTAEYDQYIFNHLNYLTPNNNLPLAFTETQELRYGENPHQRSWLIPWKNSKNEVHLADAKKIQGKELSYNNLIDADAAWKCTSDLNHKYTGLDITTIIKHSTPCGVAADNNQLDSLKKAWACDPISSFGSIIAFNNTVNADIATWLQDKFVEILIAPDFTNEALELFSKKKNMRILKTPCKNKLSQEKMIKSINGAILIQDEDEYQNYEYLLQTQKSLTPSLRELRDFGMLVNKYTKSNGITLVAKKDNAFVLAGSGMGQPNRLDSLKFLAAPRAKELGYKMSDMLLISDAFFPFRDSIDEANKLGIKNIIQPGGSIRDEEVILACNQNKIAMEFSNIRHFRH